VTFALDRQKYLIHMPLITRPRTPPTELVRVLLTKFATPLADRLIRYDYTTFQQQLFYITEAEAEAKIQPDGVANDFGRKTVVFVASDWGYASHAATVSHRLGVKQVVNTMPTAGVRSGIALPPARALEQTANHTEAEIDRVTCVRKINKNRTPTVTLCSVLSASFFKVCSIYEMR
jgi:hypothetical protein